MKSILQMNDVDLYCLAVITKKKGKESNYSNHHTQKGINHPTKRRSMYRIAS